MSGKIDSRFLEAPRLEALGSLGSSVALDMRNEMEVYFTCTLGAGDTTFTISNMPAVGSGLAIDLATGGTVGTMNFVNTIPNAPTFDVSTNYRIVITNNHIGGGYFLKFAEIV